MKKHKICKILLVILAILLCVAFYELLGICIAYKKQPEVSNTTKKETKNGSWNECSENTERAVIIEKNPEALLQRVRLIQNAKEEIILSTFAFKSDESGKLILGALHDAADRGVHIRLLVDGMESWIDMEGNPYFYGLSSHENVEIKLYNKANPLKPWKMGSHYYCNFAGGSCISDRAVWFIWQQSGIIFMEKNPWTFDSNCGDRSFSMGKSLNINSESFSENCKSPLHTDAYFCRMIVSVQQYACRKAG